LNRKRNAVNSMIQAAIVRVLLIEGVKLILL